MSIWFRVSQIADIDKVFSGDGGLITAARWNYLGRKTVYCSSSISLCTLEWLSHNGLSVSGFSYHRYSIELPDKLIKKFTSKQLPVEWNVTPATDITRDFTEKFLFQQQKWLALALPSVLVPEEYNLVINPSHNLFSERLKTAKFLGKYNAPTRTLKS